MSTSNNIPFKVKKTFHLFNKSFEEGRDYELPSHEVEILMNEGLVDIITLKSVDYLKMFKEEKAEKKIIKLPDNFFKHARLSQKYLKEKSSISEKDKKIYNDSATALRNLLRLRKEKILMAMLIENKKIEVHEEEILFSSRVSIELSKWKDFEERLVMGEKYEVKL
ncbi:MAG: hypothetical protein AMQ74_00223 [Candidatus Methanofastidiosum methylothiophilum]|uniref:GINS subunit domain-containing protein n=1 Tax=Candidatus Methanofastidiosum methylothiophilum TaxID=1705564 RepID=A0A150J9S1_9EURY|nr:MAG: hypothetical protein AMQ74_00223 [Candidatus Methanofastidiosum methylthiophilus]NMC76790.1 hypothetical protein [Candidatus Methanofastidiosa archaeon]